MGISKAALKLTQELKGSMQRLGQFKAEAQTILVSLKIYLVVVFTQAFRQLNLILVESQKNEQNFSLGAAIAVVGKLPIHTAMNDL